MTVFSYVELFLAVAGVYLILACDELRWAGRSLRGRGVTAVGTLLFMPVPFAVGYGYLAGAWQWAAPLVRAGKPFGTILKGMVERYWWIDPAGIATCFALIGLVFLLDGKDENSVQEWYKARATGKLLAARERPPADRAP